MPDELLQNHYCVAALQQWLSYNVIMALESDEHPDEQVERGAAPLHRPMTPART
jgi:hypothetical protein